MRHDPERSAYIAVEENSVTFTCTFLADPLPESATWLLNGITIQTELKKYTVTRNSENLGSVYNLTEQLTIESVVRQDAGTYRCIGANTHGRSMDEQNLTVIGMVHIMSLYMQYHALCICSASHSDCYR